MLTDNEEIINGIPRIRTINEAVREFKNADPETDVSYNLIKRLIDNKSIKFTMSGKECLVNFDSLVNYLKGDSNYGI